MGVVVFVVVAVGYAFPVYFQNAMLWLLSTFAWGLLLLLLLWAMNHMCIFRTQCCGC